MSEQAKQLSDGDQTERQWFHSGLQCRAVRHPRLLHWCGYVGLPEAHPDHGKDYDSITADVHGGLTYADNHAPNEKPDGRWWIGFDCAHLGDLVPGVRRIPGIPDDDGDDVYRDINYVVDECNKLAAQLAPQ